jgi:hypothetical protein
MIEKECEAERDEIYREYERKRLCVKDRKRVRGRETVG